MQRQNQIVLLNSFYLTVLLLLLLLNGLLLRVSDVFFCFCFFREKHLGWFWRLKATPAGGGRTGGRKEAPSAFPLRFNGSLASAVHLPDGRLKVTGSKNTFCYAFLPLLPLNLIFHQCVRAPAVGLQLAALAAGAWRCSLHCFLLEWRKYPETEPALE